MKKNAAYLLVFVLIMSTQPPARAVGDTIQSGIVWYLELYGYPLPEDIQGEIQANTANTQALEWGDVVISSMETLYDGYWIYAVASVVPSSPDEVIIMPGSASTGDLMRGGTEKPSAGIAEPSFRLPKRITGACCACTSTSRSLMRSPSISLTIARTRAIDQPWSVDRA